MKRYLVQWKNEDLSRNSRYSSKVKKRSYRGNSLCFVEQRPLFQMPMYHSEVIPKEVSLCLKVSKFLCTKGLKTHLSLFA